jgi:hypothetical protein
MATIPAPMDQHAEVTEFLGISWAAAAINAITVESGSWSNQKCSGDAQTTQKIMKRITKQNEIGHNRFATHVPAEAR